ncbi:MULTISPECIES: hypothetical protein [unclassified Roseitalea]|uniref:hypothetical protein n=1 Tax=unclassified Roseitalea TaxID=2639107 RepID=UPI00273D84B8|nr:MULTISPECIES: hypothetical protein [unclassified Roseitalea]
MEPLSALSTIAAPGAIKPADRPQAPERGAADFAAMTGAGTQASERPIAERLPAPARSDGFKGLETMMIQQMLADMLQSQEGGFFGEGLGSDYYVSFMAEMIASEVTDGMDLGIAARLEGHYGGGERG